MVSIVQRLYAALRGQYLDEEVDERGGFEAAPDDAERPIAYSADIPSEAFDPVVVDECHRSSGSVAWEMGRTEIDPSTERLVQLLVLDFLGQEPQVRAAPDELAGLDETQHGARRLRLRGAVWRPAA